MREFATPVQTCRMCGSARLEPYLDLGHMPPADQFVRQDQLSDPTIHFPLVVALCFDCGLSQLTCVVDPRILFQDEYPYEASTTMAGRAHFRAFAASVVRRFGLSPGQLAVDVGSNVGVLLSGFKEQGMEVLGVDPAENIVALANERGIRTIHAFFGRVAADRVVAEAGQATVVTATNVFAHVDDLVGFVKALDRLLAPAGVFVFEAPHFANLVADLAYDTIYHEHLSYLSIAPVKRFFERFGMRVFDVEEVDLHGGSVRVYVDRGEHDANRAAVDRLLEREKHEGSHDLESLLAFADAVRAHRDALTRMLAELRERGKRLVGVSAPAKGMTLLNYCGIGPDTLEYVTEKTALKIGRYTPGSHIAVVEDARLAEDPPDYALLLAWNFASEIMNNMRGYAQAGGRFIVPIPQPRIADVVRRKTGSHHLR